MEQQKPGAIIGQKRGKRWIGPECRPNPSEPVWTSQERLGMNANLVYVACANSRCPRNCCCSPRGDDECYKRITGKLALKLLFS